MAVEKKAAFWQRTSIQGKVRLALAGVLLLTAPQVGLTLYYLSGLSGESQFVYERLEGISQVLAVHERIDGFATMNLGNLSAEEIGSTDKAIKQLAQEVEQLANRYPNPRLYDAAVGLQTLSSKWSKAAAPPDDGDVGTPGIRRTGYVLQADWQAIRSQLNQVLDSNRQRLETSQDSIGTIFNKASRNLVSLTMLAFVFIALVIVVLPGRLVRPLRHITDVIHQAGGGKYDLEVQIQSQDEVGLLARTFRKTMKRVRDFDERKKDRIVEDGAKIDALVRHMPMAAAIVDRRYVIETANPAFTELFELSDQDIDTPLPQVFSDGGDELKSLFDAVVQHRESLRERSVTIQGETTELNLSISVDYCRNRTGDIGFLLVLVHGAKIPEKGATPKSVGNAKASTASTSV